MKIEDGKGKNGDMSVSATQRANVSCKTAPRIMYISRDDGLSYAAIFDDMSCAAGEHIAYLKNTSSTRNLFISDMIAGGLNAIKWKLFSCTGTAASGTTVETTSLNLSKNIPGEADCMKGDTAITGLTTIGQLATGRSPANSSGSRIFDAALILGPGDAIVLEYDTGTSGLCEVEFHYHYENLGHS